MPLTPAQLANGKTIGQSLDTWLASLAADDTAPLPPTPTTGPDTSGEVAPSNIAGWGNPSFVDSFSTDCAEGQFLNTYGKNSSRPAKWDAYPVGWHDTSGHGDYNPQYLSVVNGQLAIHLKTVNGRPQVDAPVPMINGKDWTGQKYGRYAIRYRADSLPRYKDAWLLWPDSWQWSDGEIDFPEGDLNGTIQAFDHNVTGNPSANVGAFNTGANFAPWRTSVVEWTPNRVEFFLDAKSIGKVTDPAGIPTKPMHWVIQTETGLGEAAPDASVDGHVYVDWVAIWPWIGTP